MKNQHWTASPNFEKLTRRPWERYILIIALVILSFLMYTIIASSEDTPLTGKTIIDHEASTMVYNEHHVGVEAHVNESDCLVCLRSLMLTECQSVNICLNVNNGD